MDKIKTGNYLTDLRKQKGLSQASLAELLGVTFQAVSKWERGEAIPDISILEQISILYGVTIDEIIKGESNIKEEINQIEKKKPEFLKQNRIYGFWISIGFLILFLILGFLPFISNDFAGANYYEIIFSNNYDIGNYGFLLQFFIVLAPPIITCCFMACTKIDTLHRLYLSRFILLIVMLLTLLFNMIQYQFIAIGSVLMMILIIAYTVLCFTLKKLKKPFISQDLI